MAILSEIVRNVLVIVLVAGFLEMLLPEGNMKPLVRLCIGLFVLIAVLNPLLGFFFSHHNFQMGSWDYQPEQAEPAIDIAARGAAVHQALVGQSAKVANAKLEEQINAVAVLVPGVEAVDTRVRTNKNGQVESMTLFVKTEARGGDPKRAGTSSLTINKMDSDERKRLEKKITNLVHNLYGFENSSIEIKFEGG